jgi:hypothetical protein
MYEMSLRESTVSGEKEPRSIEHISLTGMATREHHEVDCSSKRERERERERREERD